MCDCMKCTYLSTGAEGVGVGGGACSQPGRSHEGGWFCGDGLEIVRVCVFVCKSDELIYMCVCVLYVTFVLLLT